MIDFMVIIKIAGLMIIVTGVIIFFLHRTLISSTEGAVKRLNDEIAKATSKQAELTQKLREADEELAKRRAEAKALADKMRMEAEHETREQREKIIADSRKEGEEIITKAQGAAERLKEEMIKDIDVKGVDFGIKILNTILNDKAKGSLNKQLVSEFVENLKTVDMSGLPDVSEAEVVSIEEVDAATKALIAKIIKEKLKKDLPVKAGVDPNLGGGVMVKFGSMAIDGTVKNLLREEGKLLKERIQGAVKA